MTDRAADDFDAIRARLDEIRQEEMSVPTCTATGAACVQGCAIDDKGTLFCKKAADGGHPGLEAHYWGVPPMDTRYYNCPYEQSWAVRRNRVRGW